MTGSLVWIPLTCACGRVCRAQHIAVDAAAVVDGVVDDEHQPSYGNSAREEVSKKVAMAFDSIFFEAKPRLIPVLNHQKVHLELIKWDRLHQQLEVVEVPPAPSPAHCS